MKRKIALFLLMLSLSILGSCGNDTNVEYSDKVISVFEEVPSEVVSREIGKLSVFNDEYTDVDSSDIVVNCLLYEDAEHLIIYQYNI